MTDEELLDDIRAELTRSVHTLADPYSRDGSYAAAIKVLPFGLRAMAATHHLDISLTLDDIGWHFLNFGDPQFVKETEEGLRVLGLNDMAGWFAEAAAIVCPLRTEIDACGDYYECLTKHGHMMRINELTRKAEAGQPKLGGSVIYAAWTAYARKSPQSVFGSQAID